MAKNRWGQTAGRGLLILGALIGAHSAAAQDELEPLAPPLMMAISDGETTPPAPGPSWDEYRTVLGRLDATERQLQTLSHKAAEWERLPPADDGEAFADPQVRAASFGAAAAAAPVVAEPTKFPTVRLSGFFHLDTGAYSQDNASHALFGDMQDGTGFRRARLQALGSIAEFTNYSIEMDFATAGRPSFMDVWGEQTHLPLFGAVRIGHYRQPFSLDGLTSIKQIQFLERSLPFQAFVPFRRVGIMAYDLAEDEMTQWAYGIYRTGGFNNAPIGDSRFATDIADDGGISFSGRTTHLLMYDEPAEGRYLFHVGASYNYSRLDGGTPTGNLYEARAIPEFFVGDPAGGFVTANGTPMMADSGRLPANQYNMFGAETCGQWGPVHMQAEYMCVFVDQINAPTVFYDGAYAQAGWFLTGESKTYNKTNGALDKVVPFTEFFGLGRKSTMCGWGAWELAGRWSYVNLNDPNAVAVLPTAGPPPSPNPGRLYDTTVGLNWYWNTYSKVQFNWIHAFLDNAANGDSQTNIFCARFQTEF